MLAECLKHRITIAGSDLVLIPDLVGPVPVSEQHQYVELEPASNTCPTISVREADIDEMRDEYPGIPVYGLWQILVASELVPLNKALNVVAQNEFDGYYLHCELGRAEFSGVYEAGFFAADSNFDLEEANKILPDFDQLQLPTREAKMASELQSERQLKVRRSWKNVEIAAIWSFIAGVGIDQALEFFYSQEHEKIQNKSAMLESIRSGLSELQTSRITEVPNNIDAIKLLAVVWATFPNLKTNGKPSFRDTVFNFRLEDEGFDPARKLRGAVSTYYPEGYWLVQLDLNSK